VIHATRRSARPLATLSAIACLCTAALAQEHEPGPTAQENSILRQRGRAIMHPSDPLKLSGLEQDDNAMRAGTTALQRGRTLTAGSDQDENYLRALAMVENRATYSTSPARAPLPGAEAGEDEADSPAQESSARPAGPVETDPSTKRAWEIGTGIAAALTILAWFYTSRRN
jgi:hypothetical protein